MLRGLTRSSVFVASTLLGITTNKIFVEKNSNQYCLSHGKVGKEKISKTCVPLKLKDLLRRATILAKTKNESYRTRNLALYASKM